MIETIAYLAPEITSVSSTFVYKEILALQDKGIRVVPISVHKAKVIVRDSQVRELSKKTTYLYQQNIISALICNILFLIKKPTIYLKTLLTVFKDITVCGFCKLQSWKLLYQFLYANNVAKVLEKNSCQYLHIHFAHVPTQIGMYASLLTNIPFSFTSHANDIFENSLLIKEKVERAKTAITISEYNYKFLIQKGINPQKLKIVRCGIDTKNRQFTPKSALGKPLKIGSLGRLVEKKGMDDLIIAVSKLHKKGTDFCLEIGGEGTLYDDLKKLVKEYDVSSKIKFKGVIPNDKVDAWLKELDLFVLACKEDSSGDKDGIPVVLMEAMSIGVPVLSTEISGIPELIQNEKSGFLAKPNDPESLANTISRVLSLSNSISMITQLARNRITEEFELTTNANRLLAIFNA